MQKMVEREIRISEAARGFVGKFIMQTSPFNAAQPESLVLK